jgi:hypothetical protein
MCRVESKLLWSNYCGVGGVGCLKVSYSTVDGFLTIILYWIFFIFFFVGDGAGILFLDEGMGHDYERKTWIVS